MKRYFAILAFALCCVGILKGNRSRFFDNSFRKMGGDTFSKGNSVQKRVFTYAL